MKGLKRVKFHIDIAGECWAFVPENEDPLEVKKYLEECGAMFGGNKIYDIWKVQISDIKPYD